MKQPLDGIRVLDLGQIFLGSYCGMVLSYLGAEVIKVEPPGGETIRTRSDDGHPPQVQFLNPNKRGIIIDLKTDRGKSTFFDLVDEADVLVENFAPGTLERLDVGYETLSERNPALIYAHGSGYGDSGPYAHFPAMDLTVQAMSGSINTTGFPDQPPVRAGPSICDFIGGIHLAAGILTALFQREREGSGQYVDVAMLDAMYPVLASPISAWVSKRELPPRNGNRHSDGSVAPYSVYETADGYVAIACVTEPQWERFVELMEQPELLDTEKYGTKVKRGHHVDEIDHIIEQWTIDRPKGDIVSLLSDNAIPCAPVTTVPELVDDPHLKHRNMIHPLENQGAGRSHVPVPGMPIKLSGSQPRDPIPAPHPGEHTREILTTVAGYSGETVDELLADGIVSDRR